MADKFNFIKFNLSLFVLLVFVNILNGQNKLALLVGVGEYPLESGWSTIHGDNDIPLLKSLLIDKGFRENNIVSLLNERATKKNIINELNQLIDKAGTNDVVYIHFSTHGQLVKDINGDELDKLDESIIPYDAEKEPSDTYNGENHLIDDELNFYLNKLRNQIQENGKILILVDACHSGDSTRGNIQKEDSLYVRGVKEVFELRDDFRYKNDPGLNKKWVAISASKSYQNNYEYKYKNQYFGSLSYAFHLVLKEELTDLNFQDLFSLIQTKRREMKIGYYPQNPTLDGDLFYQRQKTF